MKAENTHPDHISTMEIIDEETEFIAHMTDVDLRLSLTLIENELKSVKEENRRLKDSLQEMCMNESANAVAAKKKKKWSQATIDKWKFYHTHKDAIRTEKGIVDWREVKRETDARFATAAASSSQTV